MLYLDVAHITLGIFCIVAAGYWSAASDAITNRILKFVSKSAAFAMMIAGAIQLSFVINAYA